MRLRHELDELKLVVNRITSERNTATLELSQAHIREQQLEERVRVLESERFELREKIVRLEAELYAYRTIIVPIFDRLSLVVSAPPERLENAQTSAQVSAFASPPQTPPAGVSGAAAGIVDVAA